MQWWAARHWMATLAFAGLATAGHGLGCGSPASGSEDVATAGLFGTQDAAPTDAATRAGSDLKQAETLAETVLPACAAGEGRCWQGEHQVCNSQGWQPAPCPAALPLCVGAACAACLPGESGCAPPAAGSSTSQQVRKCNADGLGWTTTATCALGQCTQGACADCEPGKPRCLAGKRQLCAADGKGWVDAPCASELPLCEAGQCVLCVPNLTLCDQPGPGKSEPELVLQCNAAGDDMQFLKACKAPEYCYSGACVTCVPGATRCADNGLETCDDQGSSWQPTPCVAATPFCVKGVCLACPPSEKFCGPAEAGGAPSSKVLLCDAAGAQGQLVKTCGDGQVCVAGDCALCAPGSQKCVGLLAVACDGAGASYAAKELCSLKAVGCNAGQCTCTAAGLGCAPGAVGLAMSTQVHDCAPSGDQATLGQLCAAGQACLGGQCGGCLPGQTQCQGEKALQCKADGSGWQVSEDCAAAAKLCIAGACADPCDPAFDNPSPWGCEFWALATENASATAGAGPPGSVSPGTAFTLLVVNPNPAPVVVTVSSGTDPAAAGYETANYIVAAYKPIAIKVPASNWKQPLAWAGGTAVGGLAYRLSSTLPVGAVQLNQADSGVASADTSLLWPTNALGKTYRPAVRPQTTPETRGFVAAIATAPGMTKVTLLSTAKTLAGKDAQGGALPALQPGGSASQVLAQGQVWVVATDAKGADLSGSLVEGDQPFAVLAGNKAAPVPETTNCEFGPGDPAGSAGKCAATAKVCYADSDCPQACCADHLEEQMRPLAQWGALFVVPALQPRGSGPELSLIQVTASVDGTSVFSVPQVANWPPLKAGQSVEFLASQDTVIYADQPVQVVQWMTSSQLTSTATAGDPSMAVVPPIARLDPRAVWVNPPTFKNVYVIIAAPTGAQVTLDGNPLVLGAGPAGSGWQVARVASSAGTLHQLSADRPVYAMLQGWDEGVSFLHAVGWGQ